MHLLYTRSAYCNSVKKRCEVLRRFEQFFLSSGYIDFMMASLHRTPSFKLFATVLLISFPLCAQTYSARNVQCNAFLCLNTNVVCLAMLTVKICGAEIVCNTHCPLCIVFRKRIYKLVASVYFAVFIFCVRSSKEKCSTLALMLCIDKKA